MSDIVFEIASVIAFVSFCVLALLTLAEPKEMYDLVVSTVMPYVFAVLMCLTGIWSIAVLAPSLRKEPKRSPFAFLAAVLFGLLLLTWKWPEAIPFIPTTRSVPSQMVVTNHFLFLFPYQAVKEVYVDEPNVAANINNCLFKVVGWGFGICLLACVMTTNRQDKTQPSRRQGKSQFKKH